MSHVSSSQDEVHQYQSFVNKFAFPLHNEITPKQLRIDNQDAFLFVVSYECPHCHKEIETINRLKLLHDFQIKKIVPEIYWTSAVGASVYDNEQVSEKESLMFDMGLDANRVPTVYMRSKGRWLEVPELVMEDMTKTSEDHQMLHPLLVFYQNQRKSI